MWVGGGGGAEGRGGAGWVGTYRVVIDPYQI